MDQGRHKKNLEMRYKQRTLWHDYNSPCIYMITIVKIPMVAEFSSVAKSAGGQYFCNYKPLGYICRNQIQIFNRLHPEARIMNYTIMPDHLHFIIQVKDYLRDNVGLGRLVASLKYGIRSEYFAKFPESPAAQAQESVFEKGFNDMICVKDGQLKRMIHYMQDNPRRLYLKRENPYLFSAMRRIMIDEKFYSAMGNIFLLGNPQIEVVRFSRKYSEKEWEGRKKAYARTISNGGVLVSAFIHPNEKEFLEKAIENGSGVILIENRFYDERSKPGGRLFDLCAQGKLLIISINEEGVKKNTISREICLSMNDLSARIAGNPGSCLL